MPYQPFSIQTIKRHDSSKINLKTRGSHGPQVQMRGNGEEY